MIRLEEIGKRVEDSHFSGAGKLRSRCPHCHRRSFSATEIEDRILFHCFAGCSHQEICTALGIKTPDLFFEATWVKKQFGKAQKRQSQPVTVSLFRTTKLLREYAHKLLDIADAYDHHSREVLERAKGLRIDDWTDDELERALAIVDRALQKQRLVSSIDDLTGTLKNRGMNLEKNHYESRKAY